jgi:outer membrane protein OmpA-like peptidoglycan-associated protein
MRIQSFLLAGAVFPLGIACPAFALDRAAEPAALVIAQNEPVCVEGVISPECPCPEGVVSDECIAPAPDNQVEEPADEQPADQPPAEQPAADAPAVEEPSPDAPAAEEPAIEDLPADQAPAEELAPEEPAIEQVPADEPAVEEAPAEEPAIDQAPAEEPAVEEAPAEEPAVDEAPAEEPAPDAPAAEEPAIEQLPAEEAPADASGAPDDALERARRQQEELLLQQQGEPPVEAEPGTEILPAPADDQAAEPPPADDQTAEPAPLPVEIAPGETVIEQQLEAQGGTEEAEQVQELIEELEEAQEEADEEAAEAEGGEAADGSDRDRDRRRGWWEDEGGDVVEQRGDRIIIDLGGGQIFVEPSDRRREDRLLYGADDVEVQNLPGGHTRTIVYRRNGSQIVTVRDRYGNLISRIRVTPDGREVVLFDYRFDADVPPPVIYEPGELPPFLVDLPEERYILVYGGASDEQIYDALLAPPLIEPERAYTVEEVTRNEGIRDIVPRIDLDTITFDFGSATISSSQMDELTALGQAMEEVIEENPAEVYLIEGHTDAVGSDYDNLILSDRRAEAVAVALTYNFDIPPENLITEGYGEQYLKVNTQEPERQNRRVTVRRITPLLSAQN